MGRTTNSGRAVWDVLMYIPSDRAPRTRAARAARAASSQRGLTSRALRENARPPGRESRA